MRSGTGRGARVRRFGGTSVLVFVAGMAGLATTAAAATNVAVWHMEESSGPMRDSGASPANNGTLHGSVARGAPGASGKGYSFTRGWVSVPTHESLNPGSRNITITVRVKPTSLPTSGDYDVIRKGDFPAQFYKIELLQSGSVHCQFGGSERIAAANSGAKIKPNTGFHPIRCTKTGSQVMVSVDGSTTRRDVVIGSISNQSPVVLGAHTGGTHGFFKGVMDEVSISIG